MSPVLIAMLLLVMLAALIPVRRLSAAGWSAGSLFGAWLFYSIGLFAGLRFPGLARYVLPVLIIAFVLPYVARPERLKPLFGKRRPPVINVTPPPAPGLGEPMAPPPPPPPPPAPHGRPSQRWAPGRPGHTRKPPEEER